MAKTAPSDLPPDETPDRSAAVDLMKMSDTIYANMKAIGGNLMKGERVDHTFTPTALVNEAMVKMLNSSKQPLFNNRAHLLAAAALAMRRILVDHARERNTAKRGLGGKKLSWSDVGEAVSTTNQLGVVLQLDEILEKLASTNDRQAQIAAFRLFGGMEQTEIATVLGVSLALVEKEWRKIKDFLAAELGIERKGKAT